jgi:hypothetical protein
LKGRDIATPVVLLLLAAGTLIYAYCFDRYTDRGGDQEHLGSEIFPGLRAIDVTRVELIHGDETITLEKADAGSAAGWILSSPTVARTSAAAVDVLLRELDLATRVRAVRDVDAKGLDAPRVTGRISVGRVEHRFALGADATRPEGSAYMRIEGEGTFVVNRSLKVQLLRGADAYRDRTLVPVGMSDISKIELNDPESNRVILEYVAEEFRVAPAGFRASRKAVDRLLLALSDAQIDLFSRQDHPDMAKSWLVGLVPRDGSHSRVQLRIGGPCPARSDEVIAERITPDPIIGCVPGSLVRALEPPMGVWRDPSVLYAHADEIEELRLESLVPSGEVVDIARHERGWRERAPVERELDADEAASAARLVDALANAVASEVSSSDRGELLEVRTRASFTRVGHRGGEIVELSRRRADETIRARRLDDGALLTLDLPTARRFEPHPVALRGSRMWHVPWRAANVIKIDDRCGEQKQLIERVDGTWSTIAPRGIAAGSRFLDSRLGELASAKVLSWVAERDDGTYGLSAKMACSLELTIDDGGGMVRRISLTLGGSISEGIYGRVQDDPAVFIAQPSLGELVSSPFIDNHVFGFDPDSVVSVRLSNGAHKVVLDRVGSIVVVRGMPTDRDGGTQADWDQTSFERELEALRPLSAIHFGAPTHEEGFDAPTLEVEVVARHNANPKDVFRVTYGSRARRDDADVYFVRAAGIDATFVVSANAVDGVLGRFGFVSGDD